MAKNEATEAKTQTEDRPEFLPLAQMTLKAMDCDPKEAIRQRKPVFMAKIFGEAQEVKTKMGKSGDPYSYLIGDFRGWNSNGEGFESNKLQLPKSIQEIPEAALNSSDGKAVTFGYEIYSVEDAKSPVGYKYAAKTLVKTEAQDRLEALTQQMKAAAKK